MHDDTPLGAPSEAETLASSTKSGGSDRPPPIPPQQPTPELTPPLYSSSPASESPVAPGALPPMARERSSDSRRIMRSRTGRWDQIFQNEADATARFPDCMDDLKAM